MSETEGAIYSPPKEGLPYLVVTYSDGAWTAQPTGTRAEARVLLARRTRKIKAPLIAADGVVGLVQQ